MDGAVICSSSMKLDSKRALYAARPLRQAWRLNIRVTPVRCTADFPEPCFRGANAPSGAWMVFSTCQGWLNRQVAAFRRRRVDDEWNLRLSVHCFSLAFAAPRFTKSLLYQTAAPNLRVCVDRTWSAREEPHA